MERVTMADRERWIEREVERMIEDAGGIYLVALCVMQRGDPLTERNIIAEARRINAKYSEGTPPSPETPFPTGFDPHSEMDSGKR